ncbi:MAG: esterase [Candidatus Eisenbacteria bacterium]|uniref:Esterase n=1 Tax=Eiseniibacteriota bacterium TaxID=2212470 RepID=A0A933SDH8_UNCEI|nr:esterase [Candidatus Eisenbacteria bacterium]
MSRGRVLMVEFESEVLRGNPAGDPHVRRIPIYLPPSYDRDTERRYPVLHVLTGFTGRGRMLLNDSTFSPSLDDRLDALIANGRCSETIVVMPDCWTRFGGSQYLDSAATGNYATHLVSELVPWVDANLRTLPSRRHRGVVGKSSGGFGALTLGMKHADVFGAVASHSGDAYFEYCYRPDLPLACTVLQRAGGVKAFLDAFDAKPQKGKDDFTAYNIVGMAAAYSPDPAGELGIALPFDLATGEFREDVWQRWLAFDPVALAGSHAAALRSLELLFLDCGTRDEFHLHHGTRMLSRRLSALGVKHEHIEYDDGHMNVSYRYDLSLPKLAAALAAPSV